MTLGRTLVTTKQRCTATGIILAFVIMSGPTVARGEVFSAMIAQQQTLVGQLQNIKRRHTADSLLRRAREVLKEDNLALAEFYVESAERLDIQYESLFSKFADTPQRVREAITQRRAEIAANGESIPQPQAPAGESGLPSEQVQPTTNLVTSPAVTPSVPVTLAGLGDTTSKLTGQNKAEAASLLKKGRDAIAQGNLVAATGYYRAAKMLGVAFGEGEYQPSSLRQELVAKGVDPSQLEVAQRPQRPNPEDYAVGELAANNRQPAKKDVNVPSNLRDPQVQQVAQGDGITSSSLLERAAQIQSHKTSNSEATFKSDRQRVMELLAYSQTALDRGDLPTAEQYALRAQEIRLPEAAYQTGDQRPWMALMEISKARRRQQSAPASLASTPVFTPPVSQALPHVVNGNPTAPAGQPNMTPQTSAQQVPAAAPSQQVPATTGPQYIENNTIANKPRTAAPATSRQVQYLAPSTNQPAAPTIRQPRPQMSPTPTDTEGSSTQVVAPPQLQPTPDANAAAVPGPDATVATQSRAVTTPAATTKPRVPAKSSPAMNNTPSRSANGTAGGNASPNADNNQRHLASRPATTITPTTLAAPPRQPIASNGPQPITQLGQQRQPVSMPQPIRTGPAATRLVQHTVPTDANGATQPSPGLMPSLEPPTYASPPPATIPSRQTPNAAAPVVTMQQNNSFNISSSEPERMAQAQPSPATPPANMTPISPGYPAGQPEMISEAMLFYEDGLRLMDNGRVAEAEAMFREAWARKDQLDRLTQQQLQDHLQFAQQEQAGPQSEPSPLLVNNATPPANEGQEAALQQLLGEITRRQVAVQAMKQTDPKRAWDEMNELKQQITRAQIAEESRSQLARRVDRQINELETYIESNRARIENDERNRKVLDDIARNREVQVQNEQRLAGFVEEFNGLMDQRRYSEAYVIAKKARAVDASNNVVQNMLFKSQIARQIERKIAREQEYDKNVLNHFNEIDIAAIPPEDEWGVGYPENWDDLTVRRKKLLADRQRRYSDVELEIQRSLKKRVDVQYDNVPLSQVLDQLGRITDVNIFVDTAGLAAEGVTSDTPVNINLRSPISLQSALNLILEPLRLGYVIEDEVLRVSSEQIKDGDVYPETYNVADLVIPIPNFVPNNNIGLPGAIREAHRVLGHGYVGAANYERPLTVAANNPGMGTGQTNASVLAQMGASGMLPYPAANAFGGGSGGGTQADFDTLIELITTTIEPDTWEEVGGPGAIDGFPGNLSLVVSQTQDVHEKIIDLLEQLRRLQDLQVTIEVRFITLNDDFFERIGVDFDFDIDDNEGISIADVNNIDDDGPNVTIGLDPTGGPTVDLDIPFRQGSFGTTIPTFGGFDANAAANVGFAILSDIEAFFLIQASQGDTRSNVLQAPKVTLFNGQTASISDTSQRPFVTSVIPVVGDFAAAHQPVITVLTEGTSLSVQAVVSQDRRFIRLTLVPFFSQIGQVDTFTFDGTTTSDTGTTAVDPSDNTMNVVNNQSTTTSGTTVQLPTFAFTTVNTTVSVPDGGTILLGGIKRLSEGRNERGVPMLSKLPYINRLFRNVGIGRETQSLMMMVTPRIIIQEEEEPTGP